MKAYRTIPIHECGEPLVPIPDGLFARFSPPPYQAFGADYDGESPWRLRKGVLQALMKAQARLQDQRPDWRIMLFDVYRPLKVYRYMVQREFGIKAREAGVDPKKLTIEQHAALAETVYKYWAIPSDDPATPPPHSTGAAMDITLANADGDEVDMGSPIDEGAPPAAPNFFASASDPGTRRAHLHRGLLRHVMEAEGFRQHPGEWWHFSLGDQLWAWIVRETGGPRDTTAIYGRADLVK